MANFATVGIGEYIGDANGTGKIAISNITPMIFVLLAVPIYFSVEKTMQRSLVGLLLFFNLCAWLSFLIYLFQYGWKPNIAVLGFQEIEIVFSALLIWWARRNEEEFYELARFGTICSALISIDYGINMILVGNVFGMTFGMDDKSQAAVLFCCQAFILIRYFGGTTCYIFATLLIMMSFMTISRLPVFFVPVIVWAFAQRSRTAFLVICAVVASVFTYLLVTSDEISFLFTLMFGVFDRLSAVDANAADATSSHLLLLETGLQLKFTDILAFFFGTGPGNFAEALTSFPIPIKEALEIADPSLIDNARSGLAPMHSTPFTVLLDYNIVMFFILAILLFRGFAYLIREAKYMEFWFFASLFTASMFYSLHNKPYFFLLGVTVVLLMLQRNEERGGESRSMQNARLRQWASSG